MEFLKSKKEIIQNMKLKGKAFDFSFTTLFPLLQERAARSDRQVTTCRFPRPLEKGI